MISTNQFKNGMHIEHRGTVWRIVDRCGGSIQIDSSPEAGTTVSLEPGVRFNVSAFRDVATVLITVPRDLQDVGFSLHKRDGMDVLSVTSGSKRQAESVADGPAVIAAFAKRCVAATS